MILPRFWRKSQAPSIAELYGAIVAQARLPAFYRGLGVPDSVEGRFEMIVLHLVLTMRRLGDTEAGRRAGQALFDLFCRDLDANLRELGVGDLAVPKQMRRLGEAFYGRRTAYHAALAAADSTELVNALGRNIFGATVVDPRPRQLAAYVRAAAQSLDQQDEALLLCGEVVFPQPETAAHNHASTE